MSIEHPDRAQLEARANTARSRLVETLTALDRRRHQITDVGFQLRHHVKTAVLVVGGVALLAAGGIVSGILAARRRRAHLNRERWVAAKRFWQHPERTAVRTHDRPFLTELLEKAAMTLATLVVSQLGRRFVTRALPSETRRHA